MLPYAAQVLSASLCRQTPEDAEGLLGSAPHPSGGGWLAQGKFRDFVRGVCFWFLKVSKATHHRKNDTLIDLLKRLPEDECNDAELYSVYDYARCSKLLKMSPQLKELLSLS